MNCPGLHDTYKVDYIAPGHCTGEPTFTAMRRLFGDRYLYAGLGTTLDVGANQTLRPASRSASPASDAAATVNARRSPAQ
jgi:7,8-dihydropterin-6-yl-methyl-4-(beta-D-ribofuranosyl)aminobenzene 5'-phosphate synthase